MALSTLELAERKTSVALNIAEDIVSKVIEHKWKSMYEALYLYTSVEDSGLGSFKTRTRKIIRRIEKLDEIISSCHKGLAHEDIPDKKKRRYESIIRSSAEEREYLQSKI